MRLILTEQIYRCFRIINGHAYHKWWGFCKYNAINVVIYNNY
jgi:hypothetical protein